MFNHNVYKEGSPCVLCASLVSLVVKKQITHQFTTSLVHQLFCGSEDCSGDHRDQPDGPDHDAEFVKIKDHLFIFPDKDYGGPDSVE